MKNEELQGLNEGLCNLKRLIGNSIPEIVILRGVGIHERQVADDTERDKPHLIYITRLCNGARLHVDSLCLWEVPDNLAGLLLGIDKPVASNDETGMN